MSKLSFNTTQTSQMSSLAKLSPSFLPSISTFPSSSVLALVNLMQPQRMRILFYAFVTSVRKIFPPHFQTSITCCIELFSESEHTLFCYMVDMIGMKNWKFSSRFSLFPVATQKKVWKELVQFLIELILGKCHKTFLSHCRSEPP